MKLRTKILSFILSLLFSSISFAGDECDKSIIKDIEAYLSQNSKIAIPFIQVNSKNDEESTGIIVIKKPNKFRVNYDSPHPLLITGSKNFINIYDFELEELSRVNSKDNFFRFLLDVNVSLEKSLIIQNCRVIDNQTELLLEHKETGQFSIVRFSIDPIMLKNITILDNGKTLDAGFTSLIMSKPLLATQAPDDLFTVKDPKIYGKIKRLSTEELIKKISN